MKTLDDYFTDWEGHVFGFGYGTGEVYIIPLLKKFFGCFIVDIRYDYRILEDNLTSEATWLLINILCHVDIIEYGTSPRFGWLTKKGERLRDFINANSADRLLELTCRDESWTRCYPDACNCSENGYEAGRICQNPFWLDGVRYVE